MSVAIVGAGPAGLVLAHLLHRCGIECTLFERHTRADLEARVAKAGSIDFRTVELLTTVGIAPDVLSFEVQNGRCEFRTPSESVVFDYAQLTGGRPHFVYPQHQLVARLCDTFEGDLRFGTTVTGVTQDTAGASLTWRDSGGHHTMRPSAIVGCDGARSQVGVALTGTTTAEEQVPCRLLAVIGVTPPLEPHTIYAGHPRGYAGQMRRGPDLTRFYLEVPEADTLAEWPEDRIRSELGERLLVPGRLDVLPMIEPSLVELRMRVTAPMQDRRLFLAGDAAHLITPAGGKGMNLAIQDAVELAVGLIDAFGPKGDSTRLDGYSATRLPVIWRTQAFSRWMLRMMLAGSDAAGAAEFGGGLKQGWVSALQHDPLLARWFAHAYAGVDPG